MQEAVAVVWQRTDYEKNRTKDTHAHMHTICVAVEQHRGSKEHEAWKMKQTFSDGR